MKFTLFTLAALVASALAQNAFTINTPTNAVVCQPLLLSWSGGVAPYFLSIQPGNQPSAAALEDLGQQAGTSFTWTVNIAAGTLIGLNLRDSSGSTAQSAAFTINPGSNSACVGQSSVVGGTTTAVGATSPVVGTTTTPVATTSSPVAVTTTTSTPAVVTTSTTPAGTTTTHAGSSSSKAGTSSAPAASTSSNSASGQAAQLGLAGAVGAAVIALLA